MELSEESALVDVRRFETTGWDQRLDPSDTLARVGELFAVNCLASPVENPLSAILPPEAFDGVGSWIADTEVILDDGVLDEPQGTYVPDVAICTIDALAHRLGTSLDWLPAARTDWRVVVDPYALVDRAAYRIGAGFAFREKILTERELGQAYGPRLLPFGPHATTTEAVSSADALCFLVMAAGRLTRLGGVRAHRTALLLAGRALQSFAERTASDGWWWTTEFFDDAAGRVLGIDGVDLAVVAIGRRDEVIDGD